MVVVAQWLRALSSLAENLSSVHVKWSTTAPNSSSMESNSFFWSLKASTVHPHCVRVNTGGRYLAFTKGLQPGVGPEPQGVNGSQSSIFLPDFVAILGLCGSI